MNITDDALDEFIAIYKEEFGEGINRAEASEMASRVLDVYALLARKLAGETSMPRPTRHEDNHPPIGFRT
jgi:hypothetical protein